MLANATGDAALAAEAAQPLAYTFAAVGLWQADHGYRGALPTFMQLSCIRGFYSAAFETHNTLWSLHRVLQVSSSLPVPLQLPAHLTEAIRKIVIPWGLGTLRFAYPDKLPGFVLAPMACPGGPGSCESYGNMTNDASVSIPVEVRPSSSSSCCSSFRLSLSVDIKWKSDCAVVLLLSSSFLFSCSGLLGGNGLTSGGGW